jgi:hypothetical protein
MSILLLLVLFFAPLIFQLFFGSGIVRVHKKFNLWIISTVSVVLWFATYYLIAQIFSYRLNANGSHDGMPYAVLYVMEIGLAVVLVLTILTQVLVKYFKRRNR